MKFCVNTLMISPELNIFQKIKIVAKHGFQAIEPWISEIENENPKDIVKVCNDYNVSIPTVEQIRGWFENDGGLMGVSDNHIEIMDECKRRMHLCASINAKWIIATPSFSHRNYFASWQQGIDYFNELIDIGRNVGCLPSIEFMGQTAQINTFEKCRDFLKNVSSQGTMIIDAYHLWKSGGLLDAFKNYDTEKISVFHISDANKNISREKHMDRNRVLPLDGQIDLYKFADTVKNLNYFGFINAGVYNKKLWESDIDIMLRNLYERFQLLFS